MFGPRFVSVSVAAVAAAIVPVAITTMLLMGGDMIQARRQATYVVGGDDGWDLAIPMYTWPQGKTFYAGDILVFKYDPQDSNVMVVNRTAYETCRPNDGAREFDSGNDRIQLNYGYNYFIGTYNEYDCGAGLKMAIRALASPSDSPN
ncbi:PREDICTED: basic blue protein [Tarenaya hassleriana]|uniref:basic blue protein n=1 Tax=Tarenaya hassleriana TaxID=28532 RepID=UPI00053C2ADF|nr:PREDICTED: basic blue protein [Tarenaya hassleriana]